MNKHFYRNHVFTADECGCGFWRHVVQSLQVGAMGHSSDVSLTLTREPILDPDFYKGMASITFQRWAAPQLANLVEQFFRPVATSTKTALVYAIDDAMGANDVPLYNRGHEHFSKPEVQEAIRRILRLCDFMVVSTTHIKEYYAREYGFQIGRIIAAPNLLPGHWYGGKFMPGLKVQQFTSNKARPRIGIVGSLSHFNIGSVKDANGEVVKDDFDVIADVVRATVKDFQWVIVGHVPSQVKDLVESNAVEFHHGCSILNYPQMLCSLGLQAVVAPLQENEFNLCKSAIKFLECSALGISLFASRMLPYSEVMPDSQMFSTQDELKDKLLKLKFSSNGAYGKMIEAQWKWLNSARHEGDFDLKNSWLDDNFEHVWLPILRMRQVDKQPDNGTLQNRPNVV